MKTKFLFICPTKYYYRDVGAENIKYHILSLMSHIADLADINMVDLEKEYGYLRSKEEINNFLENVRKTLGQYSPDLVGISCYTSYDYLCTVDLLRICNILYPQAILIVGGYHPTAIPEDFLSEDIPVHYIIQGEGENTLRDIIIQNGKDLPTIIQGRPLDLSMEKPIRYDLYPYKTNELYISLSRGCSYKCSFCVQSDNFPNQYRRDNIELIKEKMERAAKHLPIERFLFTDPFFGVHIDTTIEFLEYLKKKFSQMTFWAETRIDRLSRDWLKHVFPLRFDLHFGVESLADDTLHLMRKTKNVQQYIESFFKCVEMCQEYKILSRFGFIMNFPGELAESYLQTVSNMQKAVDLYKEIYFTFHSNQYALYPGNKIYEERHELAKTRGFSFPNDGWWRLGEPNIRKRSEFCYASSSIVNKYGDKRDFWVDEIKRINKKIVYKFNYDAFEFFRKCETEDILKDYYSSKKDKVLNGIYHDQEKLVVQVRFFLKKYLCLYEELISKSHPSSIEIFIKLFNYAAHEYQKSLLVEYDKGMKIDELYRRLEQVNSNLAFEYEENVTLMQNKTLGHLEFYLLYKKYRINPDGTIMRINEQNAGVLANG
jgi:Fe-S oxidoreductase